MDVTTDPLLRTIHKNIPARLHNGFPILTHDLRWHPDLPLHVMGGYAMLEVGPNALNLAGAKVAAERIVDGMEEESGIGNADIEMEGVVGGWTNRYDVLLGNE